jgi:hypothetical protein
MCIVYLQDLEDAIKTAIQFEMFVRFLKKTTIFKPKHKG